MLLKAGKPIARDERQKLVLGREREHGQRRLAVPRVLSMLAHREHHADEHLHCPSPPPRFPLPDSPFRPRWHRRRLLGPPGGGGGGNTLQYGQAARRSSSATPLRCRTTSQRRRGITVAGPPAVTLRVRPCWFRFPAWYPTSPLSSRPAILRQPRTRGRTGRHALDLGCPLGIA